MAYVAFERKTFSLIQWIEASCYSLKTMSYPLPTSLDQWLIQNKHLLFHSVQLFSVLLGQMVVNRQIINVAGYSLFLALERSQGVKFPCSRLARSISSQLDFWCITAIELLDTVVDYPLIKPFFLKKNYISFIWSKNDAAKRWLVSIAL